MKDGTRMGPVSTEELTTLLKSGAVRADALVWRDGLASWVAASTLSEFSGAIPAAVPATVSAGSGSVPPPPSAAGAPGVEIPDAADVEKNKVFGVISYLPPFLFIVALLAARQSRFAMYHCNQGLVLTITGFASWIALAIVNFVLFRIPGGFMLAGLLGMVVWLGLLAFAIIGLINAAKGECKPLPLIGNRFTLVK